MMKSHPLLNNNKLSIVSAYKNKAFAIIAGLTFLCFLPDLSNGLLACWDDAGYILDNVFIRSFSFETVRWSLTSFWCNFWAPLTWISLALDYAIWGLNPVGYHLTNNIFHALNAGLFFCLALELSPVHSANNRSHDSERAEIRALWCALLAALFFALHPLRVESVAWAAERKDVLSLFFGIPAVIAYVRHTRGFLVQSGTPDRSFVHSPMYWLAFAFFCLSLLSKPMLVSLPVVLLILDWNPLGRIRTAGMKRIIAEKIIFLIVSCIVALISMNAQKPQMMPLADSDSVSRLLNAFKTIAGYLWMTVWPVDISPFYLHPGNIPRITPEYSLPAVFVIAVTIGCALIVKKHPVPMVIWLLYLVILFPVLGFTQVGPQAMAARFTYAPSLPISFSVALLITTAMFRPPSSRLREILLAAMTGCILLFYGFVTIHHISFWKDDVTLWTRVIDLSPHASGRAYFQRGHAYFLKGDFQRALDDVQKALDIAEQKKYRAMHDIYSERAQIFVRMENYRGAIADYTRALESAKGETRFMLYMARGNVYQQTGDTDRAAMDFSLANSQR